MNKIISILFSLLVFISCSDETLIDTSLWTPSLSERDISLSGTENGYAYVDLGLSVKWATMNVGASSASYYGYYYAWGETTTKNDYSWYTYKYRESNTTHLTKYNNSSSYGAVDDKSILELSDDAANANWGGNWRMPTDEELNELMAKCKTWKWTTQGGHNGYLVTGPNGNTLFLPAAGYCDNSTLIDAGKSGNYLSSSLYTSNPNGGQGLYFNKSDISIDYSNRYYGQSVRPVCP